MTGRTGSSDAWMLLSNRLLLLQEIMVGLSQLPFTEVLTRAKGAVGWVFDGAALEVLPPEALSPPPLVARGRVMLDDHGEVYLAYVEGPPEPCYVLLTGLKLTDPQEFRLAALYCEHLLAALSAAGYREELSRQAQTDWLTGLGNRRSLNALLAASPSPDAEIGLLELLPPERHTQAATDGVLRELARRLREALPERTLLRVGAYRFALFCAESEVPGALLRETAQGWARQGEVGAVTLGGLFEQAEVRLESALAARWSAEHARRPRRKASGHPVLRVACGLPAAEQLWQERMQSWALKDPVTLLLDAPHGFALETLSELPAPVLLITDSASEPYLYDLLSEKPQGMIVGTPNDEEVLDGLERAIAGESFYRGPPLEDDGLYPRERTVLRLIVKGYPNARIARELGIKEKTVANYVTSVQEKLFLDNRVELVLYYLGKLERSAVLES